MLFLTKKKFFIISVIIVALTPLLRVACILYFPNGGLASFILLPLRWDALFWGGLLVLIEPQNRQINTIIRHQKLIIAIGFSMFLFLGLNNQGIGSLGMGILGHSAIAILACLLILNCQKKPDCFVKKSPFLEAICFFWNYFLWSLLASLSYPWIMSSISFPDCPNK